MFLQEKNLNGTEIADEKVYCDEAIVLNGITYYRGYIANTADGSLYGTTSSTVGCYTAASKGGSRKNVLFNGLPTASDVVIDTLNGIMISTTSTTYFLTYVAYIPLRHNENDLHITLPGYYSGAKVIHSEIVPRYQQFGYWSFGCEYPASGAVSLAISNGDYSENISIGSGVHQLDGTFTNILKLTASQTLTISGDAKGIGSLHFNFWKV